VEFENINGFCLTDAVTTSDGLRFNGRVPMRTNEINLTKFILEIKAFTTGLNLQNKDIQVL